MASAACPKGIAICAIKQLLAGIFSRSADSSNVLGVRCTQDPEPLVPSCRAFVFDGSVHRKTLALSDNLLSGDLPAWALQRSAVDPSLVVLLQARTSACRCAKIN